MEKNKIAGLWCPAWLCTAGLFLASLLFLSAAGCVEQELAGRSGNVLAPPQVREKEGVVQVFLQLKDEHAKGSWMRIAALELIGGENVVPLVLGRTEFAANEIGGAQQFVGRAAVPEGSYRSFRLTLEKAAREKNGGKMLLALAQPVVDLPLAEGFQLAAGESISIFLIWDEDNSVSNRAIFAPAMAASVQKQPLLADLAYVSCPEINTVFMIRTDKNWVTGSFAIPADPSYMAYAADRKRLFVLARKGSEIYAVKTATSQVLDRIKIPMTVQPTHLLSRDGRWGYVLDQEGDNLIRMDLQQGAMDRRVRLGYKPSYLAWVEGSNQLAISSALSQTVYLLDPETLATQDTLVVGNTPEGLLAAEDYLYVAESAANSLSIYDLRSRQVVKRIKVGFQPMRLVQSENRLYISNQRDGSVSLFATRQQRLIRDIRTGGRPFEMAVADRQKWLYVADRENGRVTVIDQTSSRVAGYIELGAKPLHLLVIQ
ncbi:YncE family protein [Thiovibrio sp. JS02]